MSSEKTTSEQTLNRMLREVRGGGWVTLVGYPEENLERLHQEALDDGYEAGSDDGFEAGYEMGKRDGRNGQ